MGYFLPNPPNSTRLLSPSPNSFSMWLKTSWKQKSKDFVILCLDPCCGSEDEKATWDVFIWEVAGEQVNLRNKRFYRKCRIKKVTAWNSKCCINVVRSEAKMSRPTLRPAGTLWALAKMLKDSGPLTWRQALAQKYYFSYSSQNWCKIHTNVLVFGLRM